MLVQLVAQGDRLQAARVARVPVVHLLIELAAGHADLLGVDHDEKSPQSMWGEKMGLCLPRRTVEIWVASRPSVKPVASITYHSG